MLINVTHGINEAVLSPCTSFTIKRCINISLGNFVVVTPPPPFLVGQFLMDFNMYLEVLSIY